MALGRAHTLPSVVPGTRMCTDIPFRCSSEEDNKGIQHSNKLPQPRRVLISTLRDANWWWRWWYKKPLWVAWKNHRYGGEELLTCNALVNNLDQLADHDARAAPCTAACNTRSISYPTDNEVVSCKTSIKQLVRKLNKTQDEWISSWWRQRVERAKCRRDRTTTLHAWWDDKAWKTKCSQHDIRS